MNKPVNTANKKQSCQKPPLSYDRIVSEILAGAAFCTVALLVVWRICILRFGRDDYTGSVGQLAAVGILLTFVTVFLPLYVLGSAVGVYLVGNIGKQTGSLLATLGGGLLGMFVMVILAFTVGNKSVGIVEKTVIWGIFSIIGPTIAALGFNATRRYKGTSGTFTWFPHWKDRGKATGESITAENKKQNRQKPPLSLGRIVGEVLAGIGMIFAVFLMLECIKSIAFLQMDVAIRITFKAMLSKIAPLGYGIAGAFSVYYVGSRDKQTDSFLLILAVGLFPGFLKLVVLVSRSDVLLVLLPWIYWPVVLFIVPIMATICFNLTRRYEEPPSS